MGFFSQFSPFSVVVSFQADSLLDRLKTEEQESEGNTVKEGVRRKEGRREGKREQEK